MSSLSTIASPRCLPLLPPGRNSSGKCPVVQKLAVIRVRFPRFSLKILGASSGSSEFAYAGNSHPCWPDDNPPPPQAPSSDEQLADQVGSVQSDSIRKKKQPPFNKVLQNLKRYGVSGVLSYGLLNTVYYVSTFTVVWLYIAPAPAGLGYMASVKRFLKVMAMVWAGSQVTKLARAGGALALAPLVDKGLSYFTVKFKFESRGKAFMVIVAGCFLLALLIFLAVTALWA